ncbi:MAG: hypothetical protein WAP23_02500 [Candidatus Spechtbacterales bacterium]
MCTTTEPARLSGTILFGKETMHPNGKVVHTMGYQNRAQNLAEGPNAMILPFPAIPGSMSQRNVLDTSRCPQILEDMARALTPRDRGEHSLTFGASRGSSKVEVFHHGIYTVVLAEDASAIPGALDRVEPDRRPPLNTPIFETYSEWYPAWGAIALCCFNNKYARDATPMLWWYEPIDPEELFLPGLDCHTGGIPDLNAHVRVDHTIAVASYRMPATSGVHVSYTNPIPESMDPFLSERVTGNQLQMPSVKNGDFIVNLPSLWEGEIDLIRRNPLGVEGW